MQYSDSKQNKTLLFLEEWNETRIKKNVNEQNERNMEKTFILICVFFSACRLFHYFLSFSLVEQYEFELKI